MSVISPSALKPQDKYQPIALEKLIGLGINKPGRYIGQELGVQTHNWESAKVRWALTYPDLYEVGASNLGHIILYSILNSVPGQLCDRSYLPASDLAKRLREHSHPLFAVESRRPLAAFDILGFSLSYELVATNILEMLSLAQIPLYQANRGELGIDHPDSPPLIFAGGPTATSNPEPYAPFFDFFAIGDGEELLPEIGLVIAEAKSQKLGRTAVLHDLSEVPGIYVPSLFEQEANQFSIHPKNSSTEKRVLRRVATPMPQYGMGLVPNIETIHDRLTIEIRRGCTRGCRFCQPGMLTRPARDVDPKEVINAVKTGMEKTGYSDFSLLSLSCSDYLALPAVGVELRNQLANQNVTLQLPSQRVDRFDDNIAHILGGTRQAGLTFAPEAGTQRLRDIINKGLTDSDLINGIRKAMENGFRKVKLYFMIGLPGETDEDVLGIASTCQMLQEKCRDLGRLKLNITISNFTPKPHTPFQWHSVSKVEFERLQDLLKTAFRSLRGVKANFTDVRLSAMEDFIGRGDRRIAPVIEAAWRAGAGMDAWFESLDRTYLAWTRAISVSGLKEHYRKVEMGNWNDLAGLSTDELIKNCTKPLPWDHIDSGISKSWLAEELKRALESEAIPDCSFEKCSKCGVCGPELGHNIVVEPPAIPKQLPKQSPPSEKACRIQINFAKTGSISLLSHLDLVRILERALRRSQLPISYTEGFHPLPRLKIALALPLGIEAFGEWMEIDFTKELEPERMKQRLEATLPDGLKLISAKRISTKKPSLSQKLFAAVWSFELTIISGDPKPLQEWNKAIDGVLNAKKLIWHDTDKKGRARSRDFKKVLDSIKLDAPTEKNNDARPTNTVHIQLETKIDSMGLSLKPIQIKHWLEQQLQQPLEITGIKRDELKLLQC